MTRARTNQISWSTSDLDLLAADEWKHYEIIDGELFVTRAPHAGRAVSSSRKTLSELSADRRRGERVR